MVTEEDILFQDGGRRIALIQEMDADEPYSEGQSPVMRVESGYHPRVSHVGVSGRPVADDDRIEEAVLRWVHRRDFEEILARYLRIFYGASQVKTWSSGISRDPCLYITYDTKAWRDWSGAPENSVSLDEWKAYVEGDVWIWVTERLVTYTADDDPSKTLRQWETIDSCGGYYGRIWAEQAALDAWREAQDENRPASA